MSWTVPTTSDFKSFFNRDFNYAPASAPNDLNYVCDSDITKAINLAFQNFNPSLFGTDAQVTNVFMYLVAFYLVYNIQTSTKGLYSQSKFPISSSSVGGVAVTYELPERYAKDPTLSLFTQNGYGMLYLSFALPQTVGNVGVLNGTTTFT